MPIKQIETSTITVLKELVIAANNVQETLKTAIRKHTEKTLMEIITKLAAKQRPSVDERSVLAAAIDVYAERHGDEAADKLMDDLGM